MQDSKANNAAAKHQVVVVVVHFCHNANQKKMFGIHLKHFPILYVALKSD